VKWLSFVFLFLVSCTTADLGNGSNDLNASDHDERFFLDYASSFPIRKEALGTFIRLSELRGNSSGVNPHAKKLADLELASAAIIAKKINADHRSIHFTSSATIANNIAILGVALKNPRCHFITSKIEHKSVLNVFKHLESEGYGVTYLNVDQQGNVNLQQLRCSITPRTRLISVQMLNSEIGVLQDIKKIGEIAQKHNLLFHVDAAQSFCKYDIDVNAMHIDLLTIAGHKIGAPKGIAAICVRDPQKLQPILFGSGDMFFPGTKPTPLIGAFGAAVENFKFDGEKVRRIFDALAAELLKIEKIHINSSTPSHIMSVSIDGVLLSDILKRMKDYSFSAGCSCLGQEKSNVIAAIDPQEQLPPCTLRISFSDETDIDEVVAFGQHLKTVVENLRREKSVSRGCSSKINSKKLNDILKLVEKKMPKKKRGHYATASK
jgi:cysteine desulfurase